jgi:single-strand DNA-binding protein
VSVNKAILIGNLGKDPEIRYTQSGKAVTSFSLATSEKWKGQDGQQQESTTWHNIVAWGRQAEVLKEYTGKGSKLYIEGRISNRTYDKKDGTKGFTSEVVVQNFQFLDAKKDATEPAQAAPNTEADDDLPF